MTRPSMLDIWASNRPERVAIVNFWDWLSERRSEIIDIHIEKELDAYHGIDQAQLERERRKLISDQRSTNERQERERLA